MSLPSQGCDAGGILSASASLPASESLKKKIAGIGIGIGIGGKKFARIGIGFGIV